VVVVVVVVVVVFRTTFASHLSVTMPTLPFKSLTNASSRLHSLLSL